MRVGVVGGTSLSGLVDHAEPVAVETPFGDVTVRFAREGDLEWVFLSRHGEDHALPPHRVPFRANAWAMRACRVDRVLAVASVGSLRRDIAPGAFVVPDDYVDFSDRTERSFFDSNVVHVDVSEAYCPECRGALVAGAEAAGVRAVDGGVYAATPGPRFETRAEAKFLAGLAHVVGMTGCPEAALMRELGLCYATLAVVANHAPGVAAGVVSTRDVVAAAREREAAVRVALRAAAERLALREKGCACARSLEGARVREPVERAGRP